MESRSQFVNVIALLCRNNNIGLADLGPLVSTEFPSFSAFEKSVANKLGEQLDKLISENDQLLEQSHEQISGHDLIPDEHDLLDISNHDLIPDDHDPEHKSDHNLTSDDYELVLGDPDFSNRDDLPEPCDDLEYDDDSEEEFDDAQDPTYEPPPEFLEEEACASSSLQPAKKRKVNPPLAQAATKKKPIAYETWARYFGYWTRQIRTSSDRITPVVVSQEFLDLPSKSKRSWANVRTSCSERVGEKGEYLKSWAKKAIEGKKGSMRDVNEYVYSKFQERRKQKLLKTQDHHLQSWAREAKKKFDPNMRFRATKSWVVAFKKRHNIVSRKVTHKVSSPFAYNKIIVLFLLGRQGFCRKARQ